MAPNWKPLVAKLGKKRCVGFMFMGRVNGINLYKHGITRMYLNLDDSDECYVSCENSRFEKADFDAELRNLEAALAQLGENLESVYDESYIEQKRQTLRRVGISHERIEIQPEDLSIKPVASVQESFHVQPVRDLDC
ncbi:MAG: hypothetical protein WAR24_19715 [Candidatus Acidiferrales bacterium]